MSGHSHFATIKHKKALTDAKRGKIFSKLSRQITIAAKEKGGSLDTNPKLKIAVEQAKEMNMPKDNIERAIKKGTGELVGEKLEEFIFEAFGPGGIAIIIEGITDNKNRSLGEIKQILAQYNGKMAGEGSVRWLFERKGCIIIDIKAQKPELQNKENIEIEAIEAGANDLYWHDDMLDVYTSIEDLEKVKKSLEQKGTVIESASPDWVAKEKVDIGEKEFSSSQNLFEALDDNDSVQDIYSNLKN